MQVRICPECGVENFSGNTSAEFWRCWQCGGKVSVEHVVKKPEEKGGRK
jgi:ribosomal protein L37AE/L43A